MILLTLGGMGRNRVKNLSAEKNEIRKLRAKTSLKGDSREGGFSGRRFGGDMSATGIFFHQRSVPQPSGMSLKQQKRILRTRNEVSGVPVYTRDRSIDASSFTRHH